MEAAECGSLDLIEINSCSPGSRESEEKEQFSHPCNILIDTQPQPKCVFVYVCVSVFRCCCKFVSLGRHGYLLERRDALTY